MCSELKLYVGDEVTLLKKDNRGHKLCGIIKFIGYIARNESGIWYGIQLNKTNKYGTSNGEYQHIQYFQCPEKTSIFVQYHEIDINIYHRKETNINVRFTMNDIVSIPKLRSNGIIKYVGYQLNKLNKLNKHKKKKYKYHHSHKQYEIGDNNDYTIYYGIELSSNIGNSNGIFNRNQIKYFQCKPNYGIFVRMNEISTPYSEYEQSDLLIYGYIHFELNINDIQIPLDIIHLLFRFSAIGNRPYNRLIIVHLDLNETFMTKTDKLEVKMVDINNRKDISFRFKPIDHSFNGHYKYYKNSSFFVEYDIHQNLSDFMNGIYREYYGDNNGICGDNKKLNSMLIRFGGQRRSRYLHSELILFDSNDCYKDYIDGFIYSLPKPIHPSLEKNMLIYDKYNNYLLAVGGNKCNSEIFTESMKIYHIDLNKKKQEEIKWNVLKCSLPKTIQWSALEILNERNQQYLICGGGSQKIQYDILYDDKCYNDCLQLKLKGNQPKLKQLTSMNYARKGHCICKLKGNDKNKIIVVGGIGDKFEKKHSVSKTSEIYDIVKNKWILLKNECNYQHRFGCIWIDDYNSNRVFVAGDLYETMDNTKNNGLGGFIEWIDLRDNNQKWKTIKNKLNIGQLAKPQCIQHLLV